MIHKRDLHKELNMPVKYNQPMSDYTSWKVGGPAECFLTPSNTDELAKILKYSCKHNMPTFIFGNGTNLLVLDSGIRGMVVNIGNSFSYIEASANKIKAGSGTSMTRLARYTAEKGLAGLEFAAGIPGSLGGAVIMNAGAFGGHIGERVSYVKLIDTKGEEKVISKDDLVFGYRSSNLEGSGVIVEIGLNLSHDDPLKINNLVEHFLEERKKRHPGLPSAGSVFRNLPELPAGRIIENAGCKGMRIGGAEVSTHHANFIVNTGNATAADILKLIKSVQHIVKDKFDLLLIPEVRIVGEE